MAKPKGTQARRRSRVEVETAFEEQILALQASCRNYDAGQLWEAKRIATAVYTLVHDPGRAGQSLLSQLGLKKGARFIASGLMDVTPGNFMDCWPLCGIRMRDRQAYFVPHCHGPVRRLRPMSFNDWWEKDLIFASSLMKHTINRKQLVYALRNREGGAHYDPKTDDEAFDEFAWGHAMRFDPADGSEAIEIRDRAAATMRQIGWELLETFGRQIVLPHDAPPSFI